MERILQLFNQKGMNEASLNRFVLFSKSYTGNHQSILILLFCLFTGSALPAQITFIREYGSTNNEAGFALESTSAGGYAIAGASTGLDMHSNVFMIVTDSLGDTLWTRSYIQLNACGFVDMIKANNGGYFMVGEVYMQTAGETKIAVTKTDGNGNVTWAFTYFDSKYSVNPTDAVPTSDGGLLITGNLDSVQTTKDRGFLMKIDSSGALAWMKKYSDTSGAWIYFKAMCAASNGDFVLVGNRNFDAYVMRVDSAGEIVWSKVYSADQMYPEDVTEDSNGELIVLSLLYDSTLQTVMHVMRIASDGQSIWAKTYQGAEGTFIGKRLSVAPTGDIFVCGEIDAMDAYPVGVLMQISSAGNCMNTFSYNSIDDVSSEDLSIYRSAVIRPDGSCALLSYTNKGRNVELIKMNSDLTIVCGTQNYLVNTQTDIRQDTFITLGVESLTPVVDSITITTSCGMECGSRCLAGIEHSQPENNGFLVYPNPGNDFCIIQTPLGIEGNIQLYNSLGEVVLDKQLKEGRTQIICSEFARGMYFYAVVSDEKIVGSGKLILE